MNITLRLVDPESKYDLAKLYDLLEERQPYQAISHKEMPTFNQHTKFVQSKPYKVWYIIAGYGGRVLGSIYISKQDEIGISVFEDYIGKGVGGAAVKELMRKHDGPFLANINPKNTASIKFFESLGFKLLQVTYEKE